MREKEQEVIRREEQRKRELKIANEINKKKEEQEKQEQIKREAEMRIRNSEISRQNLKEKELEKKNNFDNHMQDDKRLGSGYKVEQI